jgi:uncharacterized protein (TIGR00369 family)
LHHATLFAEELTMTPEDVPAGISIQQLAPWLRSLALRPLDPISRQVTDDGREPSRVVEIRRGGVRRRTVTWTDPKTVAALLSARDGIDALQAVARGEVPAPPIAELMGLTIESIEPGRVVFAMEPAEFLYNPIGSVHGGALATLMDSAMGCAVHTVLPAGTGYTTLDLAVKYVRPVTVDTGRVLGEGTVVHQGGRICTAEGRVTAPDGRLLAHATTTCLVLGEAVERPRAA